jgi:hypothetical protein
MTLAHVGEYACELRGRDNRAGCRHRAEHAPRRARESRRYAVPSGRIVTHARSECVQREQVLHRRGDRGHRHVQPGKEADRVALEALAPGVLAEREHEGGDGEHVRRVYEHEIRVVAVVDNEPARAQHARARARQTADQAICSVLSGRSSRSAPKPQ